jgi:hypothetical protein
LLCLLCQLKVKAVNYFNKKLFLLLKKLFVPFFSYLSKLREIKIYYHSSRMENCWWKKCRWILIFNSHRSMILCKFTEMKATNWIFFEPWNKKKFTQKLQRRDADLNLCHLKGKRSNLQRNYSNPASLQFKFVFSLLQIFCRVRRFEIKCCVHNEIPFARNYSIPALAFNRDQSNSSFRCVSQI